MFPYEDYAGDDGIRRFSDIAKNFDFGKRLGRARFPESFIQPYVISIDMDVPDDPEYVLARYDDGNVILMISSILSPDHIHSTNAIVAESLYAPAGSIILPPGHYIFGDAYSDVGQHMLLVDLREDGGAYGSIHAWQRGHDPLGEGDNARGTAYLAPDLRSFLESLTTDKAALL
ncbi:hypothetical protein [Roseobacter weihaiensis]|uniref:hypothetical protein n=1 Tax=Roseobacter weihaiensis TaxID=2763262 RepID=UPI001D0A4943|nr:hypothetical protein [Roseobacter sp. H9]